MGVLKITLHKAIVDYSADEALYVDKIYIKKEFTGQGLGQKTLQFVSLRAKELNKKIIWLDAMQKGPALGFYQKNGFQVLMETKVPFKTVIEEEKLMFVLLKKL